MTRNQRPGSSDTVSRRRGRRSDRRRSIFLTPRLEGLEARTVLSTITWNATTEPNGGDWDVATNWNPPQVPTASDDAVINLTSAGNVTVGSGVNAVALSLTTNSKTTFIDDGSLSLGADNTTIGGPLTIASAATMNVAADASVNVKYNQTVADNGSLGFGTDDTVTLGASGYGPAHIVVAGTLTASGTTFTSTVDTSNVMINSGGTIMPTDSTFNVPLFVPYNDVQYLANNESFDQIEIIAGTLSTGTLNLDLIGTNSSNLSYVFPGGFTIGTGGTLDVGPTVPVTVQYNQTLSDAGSLSFSTGDMVTLGAVGYGAAHIVVDGTLTASGTTFTSTVDTSNVMINSDGTIMPTDSTFAVPLYVPYNDVQYLANNQSFDQIEIIAGTLSTGTLNLDLIGTNSSNLSYVFPGGFTIGTGGTLDVGTYVPVTIQYSETLNDNGVLNFDTGDVVTLGAVGYGPAHVVVNGTLTASGTTFTSNVSTSNVMVNSGGIITPDSSTFDVPLYVPYNDVQALSNNQSFNQIEIIAGTLSSGTVNLDLIGTNTSNLSYVFSADFTIASGGTIDVGPYVPVTMQYDDTLTDNGLLSFADGDTVTLGEAGYGAAHIVVNGTLSAGGTTFTSNVSTSNVMVNSGGIITPTGSTFDVPLFVPYNDVQALSNNQSFNQIEIIAGTLSSGTVNLNLIGVDTSNLSYVFSAAFTIASGGTLDVGNDVPVTVQYDQTLTDNGVLNFGIGDTVTLGASGYGSAHIVVGGALTAIGTTFTTKVNGSNLTVNSGGNLVATNNTTFDLSTLTLSSGSSATLNDDVFYKVLAINSNTTINISGNDFSNLTNPKGLVASGSSSAQINLTYNYWGTTDPTIIASIIDDNHDNSSLPTVDFVPFVSYTSGTSAASASATYSSDDQSLTLSATVSSSLGLPINEGTETFTILNGTAPVGSPVTVDVVNSLATTTMYTLPGGTPSGEYIIEAYYSGSGSDYLPATDLSHYLTISPAPASQLSIAVEPSMSATAGQPFAIQPVIYEEDQYGNIETGDNSTIITATLASGAGPLQGIETATVVAGVATFTNLSDDTAENITLSFSSGNLTPATSSTIDVSPAPAAMVAFGQGPTSTIAGIAMSPAVTVDVLDTYGNLVVGDGSTVTLTLSSGTFAGGSNTVTATALNGVATFPNLIIDTAGSYTLSAIDGTLTASGPSSGFTVSAASATKLAWGQEPSNAAAGTAISPPVTVDVEDQFNNIVTTDSSTVALMLSNGTFAGGSNRATATAVNGVATFAGLEIDTPGNYTLSATDGSLTPSGASASFTISAAAASKVVFSQEPTSTTAGVAISPAVTVLVEDAVGNIITTDDSAVTLTLSSSTFAGGLTTDTVNAVNGVATFPNLIIDEAGAYTLSATDGNLNSSGPSNGFTISAASAAKLAFGQNPSNAAPGAAISPPVTIIVEDTYGNIVTGDSSTVALTLNTGTFAGGSNTATAAAVNGVATFSNLIIDTPGTYTLSGTDGALTPSGPSNSFIISATGASKLGFGQGPTNTTAGTTMTPPVTVDVEDAFGNLVTTDHSVVTLTLSTGTFAGGSTSATATAVGGIATFSNLTIDTAGTYTLSATDGLLTGTGASNSFMISPAATGTHLLIHTQPSSSATAGQSFGTQPVIYLVDQYGNLETNDNSDMVTASLAGGGGTLLGDTHLTVTGGMATFTNLEDDTAGPITLKFSSGGLSSVISNLIIVMPGPATNLVVKRPPSGVVAGISFGLEVDAMDDYDNLATSFGSPVTVGLASGSGGTLTGTVTMTAVGGVALFTNLVSDTSGSISLSASGDSGGTSLTSPPTGSIAVSPAPADHFVVVTSFANPDVAGTVGTITITAEDQFGNVAGSGTNQYLGAVDFSCTDILATGVPTYYPFTAGDAGSHTFTGVILKTAGPQTITATDSVDKTITGATTVDVVPGAVKSFAVTTTFANPDVAGTVGTVVVTAEDAYGNTDGSGPNQYLGMVELTSTDSQAAGLPSSHIFTAIDAGAYTFVGVILKTAGAQTVTATDSVDHANTGAVSINVVPSAAQILVVTTNFAITDVAGATGTVTVTAEDAFNNRVSGGPDLYLSTVYLSNTDSLSTGLPPSYTFTAGDAGSHTFAGVVMKTTGVQTITATDSVNNTIAGAATVDVVPAGVKDFDVTTTFANPDVAGTVGTVVVTAVDAYGNTVGSGPNLYVGTVNLTSTDAQAAGLPASHLFTASDAGSFTFAGVALKTAGAQTITATDSVRTSILGTSSVNVTAGPVSQLVLTTPPPDPIVAGQSFTLGVSGEDAFGNVVPTFSGSVTISLPDDTGLTTTVQAKNGVATFTGLVVNTSTVQGQAITVMSGGLKAAASSPVTVTFPHSVIQAPTVISEQPVKIQLYNKKGKKTGKPAPGFALRFSTTMNASTAGLATNYHVYSTVTTKVKKMTNTKLKPVGFTSSYNPATNTVTLKVKSTQPFAKAGGEIMISGVTDGAGTLLDASDTVFIIGKNGKSVGLQG